VLSVFFVGVSVVDICSSFGYFTFEIVDAVLEVAKDVRG
jgi:hypothetical protein